MNAIVTARVPVEMKAQVEERLRGIHSTPTELINAAYRYVLENGSLPVSAAPEPQTAQGEKALPVEVAAQVKAQWESRAILGSEYDGDNFKELLDEARGEYFARFA